MYNALFGENDSADFLLKTLGLKKEDFGRFRDAYLDGGKINVYTRLGGGNSEDYPEVFELVENHPCYAGREQDEFDCTYLTFKFNYPDKYKKELEEIEKTEGAGMSPEHQWKLLFRLLNQ